MFQIMSRALDAKATGIARSEHIGRQVLTPDEVRNLPQTRELLLIAGRRPILTQKLQYHADREFAGSFDPA